MSLLVAGFKRAQQIAIEERRKQEGLQRTALQVIDNAISAVENLNPDDPDPCSYLVEDWLPFAKSVAGTLHTGKEPAK